MLSRRNIRIKVMQVLYAMNRDNKVSYKHAVTRYRQSVDKSFELFLFNLLILIRAASYARQDAATKTTKLRPTEYDRNFTAKFSDNPLTSSLLDNEALSKAFKEYKLEGRMDNDIARKLYSSFAETDDYIKYIELKDTGKSDNASILLAFYKHCVNNELFVDLVEDHFPTWEDDKSLVVGSIKKVIKALPANDTFLDSYRPNNETVKDFGETLLAKVCEENETMLEIIEPHTQELGCRPGGGN